MAVTMPDFATHLYDRAVGICPDLCSLSDLEAERVIDGLRRRFGYYRKPDYLAQRRRTEAWLAAGAERVLGRRFHRGPGYFFLGDFSHSLDPARPEALLVPLAALPADGATFTLGDSMGVAVQAEGRVLPLAELVDVLADGPALAGFGFSDREGFQARFIEVQLWDRDWLTAAMRRGTVAELIP